MIRPLLAAVLVIVGVSAFAQTRDPYVMAAEAKVIAIQGEAKGVIDKNDTLLRKSKLPPWVIDAMNRIIGTAGLAVLDLQRVAITGTGNAVEELIPAARLTTWTPGTYTGVPGGIPTGRTQCVTTECAAVTGAAIGYKNGTNDAASLLQAAITSAPANTYVLMPAGTWKILSMLLIGPSDDSVTLRGSGVGTTTIDCRVSTCIRVGSDSDYNWAWPTTGNSVTGYAASGSNTVLTLADTSNFSTGQIVRLAIDDDRTIPVMNVGGYGADNDNYSRRQMTQIVSKTGTTLTVFPAIYGYAGLAGFSARVNVAQFQTDLAGVEDLTVDGTNGSVFAGIHLVQTAGSWITNVRVYNATNYHVYMQDCLQPEVRKNTLETRLGGGSNGAALLVNTVSGALIEDNILREAFPNIEVNAGSSGNVVAYNFMNNADGSLAIDTNHGPHNRFNLYEGNVTTNLMSDGYFGGEDSLTIYRNLIHGNGIVSADTNVFCLSLKRFTRLASIVGNLFGGPYTASTCAATDATGSFGQPNIGNGSWTGTAQPSASDWWADFNGTDTTLAGQLTTRTDDTHGIVTLSSGTMAVSHIPYLWSSNGQTLHVQGSVTSAAGNAYTITALNGTFPALNTLLKVWPGNAGYQEKDLDVEATTVLKANYDTFTDAVTGSLGGATLSDSLYRSAKPSWFNSLTWPPFTPTSPNLAYAAIPAGYRYLNAGSDPP